MQLSLSPVDIIGKEGDIRKFFKDFYYEVDIIPHTIIPFQTLKEMIPNAQKSERLTKFFSVSPSDLRYFLYIMIQRCKNDRMMDILTIDINYTKEEMKFLDTLKDSIKKQFQYELNDNELLVTYLYVMSQRKIIDLEGRERILFKIQK